MQHAKPAYSVNEFHEISESGVVGHLTGPSGIMHGRIPAATLYLHGDAVDESLWRYDKAPGSSKPKTQMGMIT